MGAVQMRARSSRETGKALLQQSLDIALKNSYQEHVARAYTNMGNNGVVTKDYVYGKNAIEAGLRYCEERDLDAWSDYMLTVKARLSIETGQWPEAYKIADSLLKNENQPSVIKIGALLVAATIRMRKGEPGALTFLLEAKTRAMEAMELQRILPALSAMLEYEWITGETIIDQSTIDLAIDLIAKTDHLFEVCDFGFWLHKARQQQLSIGEGYPGYDSNTVAKARKAAAWWQELGCAYEQALALYEGSEDDKRTALSLIHGMGAVAVYEKLKLMMRNSGIKSIPRGIRKTTSSNSAQLTSRELDVLALIKEGMQNKEIASKLFISSKTVDHHISALLFKLDAKTRVKAVQEAVRLGIVK
jgi:DNA-binding CsgD family transcriptional regulator